MADPHQHPDAVPGADSCAEPHGDGALAARVQDAVAANWPAWTRYKPTASHAAAEQQRMTVAILAAVMRGDDGGRSTAAATLPG